MAAIDFGGKLKVDTFYISREDDCAGAESYVQELLGKAGINYTGS